MHVALSDPTRGVPKQSRDGQFGEPEIARHAREGMVQDVRRDALELTPVAYAVENADYPTKWPSPQSAGKTKRAS